MQPFTTITDVAVPYLHANVDTDVIIPIQRLLGTTSDGLGPFAFERLRYNADGSDNPDFLLNRPEYKGSGILMAAENFACGSSREGAVWALMGMGVRCVIAPSFGDIFFSNCFQNGMLPVRLPIEVIRRIAEETEASPGNARTTVDLARRVVITPTGAEIPFEVDARRREALLEGLDDISLTKRHAEAIAAWRAKDRAARPWASEGLSR
ncbi:3-isopropylmalate dehydratase small subunit [Rhodovarius crocodyli]|uniref:3-isopropylmalate dehydratase small subunit n=1 Tax=Rhodovarius crocodyli TaxID=1979269 RepID=A0A437MK05_9PROT|nr:3-isopropylmalate dehydratase small subunit [Rhodovarius crocodyli]RVT97963.1 3-isopropylmalate dehydratase small subunit [Rhodovarius crocodyli]